MTHLKDLTPVSSVFAQMSYFSNVSTSHQRETSMYSPAMSLTFAIICDFFIHQQDKNSLCAPDTLW